MGPASSFVSSVLLRDRPGHPSRNVPHKLSGAVPTATISDPEQRFGTALPFILLCSVLLLFLRKVATALFLLEADSNPPVLSSTVSSTCADDWSNSSPEEGLALRHIAEDGLLTSSNTRVLRMLMGRGLIIRNPTLSFKSEEFCAFVVSVPTQTIRTWESSGERSGWSELQGPVRAIVAIAIIFLFLTEPDLLSSTAATIGALAVALP